MWTGFRRLSYVGIEKKNKKRKSRRRGRDFAYEMHQTIGTSMILPEYDRRKVEYCTQYLHITGKKEGKRGKKEEKKTKRKMLK